MTVILRNISNNSSSSANNDGFPPGDVEIIRYNEMDSKVQILWSDPEDTYVDSAVFSVWAGTILVRNDDHFPVNIKDGIIVIDNKERNKYKETYFEDTGLTNGHTYYYRFFTYNPNGVYNNSGDLVFKATPYTISPVLENNSWETIIDVANAGSGQDYWNVGDEITLQISGGGIYTMTCTMQIWDFNHFDKADGSGKANICFGCKDIYLINPMHYGSSETGWINMDIRKTDMQKVYNGIPSIIRDAIKEVTIQYNPGYSSNKYTCNDKVFIPSLYEVGLSKYNPLLGTPLPIFSDNASRIKNDMRPNYGGDGSPNDFWWTRTLDNNSYGGYSIHAYGYANSGHIANKYGIVFCFNI